MTESATEERATRLPRPAAPLSLRRRLALVLVGAAVGSVLVLGSFNYWAARTVLDDQVDQQLETLQNEQAKEIRSGLERLRGRVAASAADARVVAALADLGEARAALGAESDLVDAADVEALSDWYRDEVLGPLEAAEIDVGDVDDLLPTTDAGRAMQLRYTLGRPASGDDSAFAEVHDRYVGELTDLAELTDLGDLLLVDRAGNVVFSVAKSIDFGTNLLDGPYDDSGLADALNRQLPTVPTGDGVYVDFARYLPASGAPVLFIAAAVRADSEVVGSIAFQVDAAALTELTTAGQRWEEIGLGDSGETYVVGADGLLRSDSRLWLEDPDEYLRALEGTDASPRVGELIELFGSTVLLQPAETDAVRTALDGEVFSGSATNYLGRSTSTFASPVGVEGLDWVIVADIGAGETDDAIDSYLGTVLLLAAILVPIVWLCGLWLAHRLTRPVTPLLAAADSVASGDLETTAPDLGGDELGDLARRLNDLTNDLRSEEEALAAEEAATTEMLLAALPPRLVSQIRSGEQELDELVDRATVVSITTMGLMDELGGEAEVIELTSQISRRLELLAVETGVERGRSSADHHLFTAGLDSSDDGAAAAAAFVLGAKRLLAEVADEESVHVSFRAGLATGDLATGLVGSTQLSFGLWGEPPRRALALDAVASPGQVLLDPSVVEALGDGWSIEPIGDLVDLGGAPISAAELVGSPAGTTATS
ncbi:MAG: HAMP domain-containing protein [Actinomycetota bacterium]